MDACTGGKSDQLTAWSAADYVTRMQIVSGTHSRARLLFLVTPRTPSFYPRHRGRYSNLSAYCPVVSKRIKHVAVTNAILFGHFNFRHWQQPNGRVCVCVLRAGTQCGSVFLVISTV